MTDIHLPDRRAVGDILVVDDNPANLLAIEAALGDLADGVVSAQSGQEALRLLLDRDFALILLDVKMPSMGGFETAKLIRERKRSRHTPIIFVTAHGRDDRDIAAAYELGAVDFLFKPIVPEILRAKASVFVELERRAVQVAQQAEQLREHERRAHEQALEDERRRWDEEAMRRRVAELAEADRRKDEFLAMLGHELRNPLAPIVSGLDLLGERLAGHDDLDPVIQRTHKRMQRQVEHLTRMVDDLLDVARINSGKIELRKGPVVIQELIEQAVATSRPVIDERRQRLTVDMPSEPIVTLADPVRLTQVVANLLNNSARYTDEGGAIRVQVERCDAGVEIRVEDNGRGIAPELLHRIFELFVQERRGRNGGLGLGLTLVKRLVSLHDGTVEGRSEGLGKGSQFVVRLPLEAPAAHAADAESASTGNGSKRACRIVLVEDNDDVRETMHELLSHLGHEVHSATDGVAGAELILRVQPELALVDVGLPELDGYEVAARVRSDPSGAKIRLIAMSGYGQDSDRKRSHEAGFDAHLVKPVELDELTQILTNEAV